MDNYFFTVPKINIPSFSRHNFGEWNKYLEATDGALSLKHVTTNYKNGYIVTSIATEISKQQFKLNDFVFPEGYKLEAE